MQNQWIFECESYRAVLEKKLKTDGESRGYRTDLANAAGCQLAYISHVLSGRAQFTPDQAVGICEFWNFDDLETEYFMQLVHEARAATPRLLARIEKKKRELRREHQKTRRTRISREPYAKERVIEYYLDWLVSAIHVAITVPSLQDSAALAKRFSVEESRVRRTLTLLQDLGFAEKVGSKWKSTALTFHAADESKYALLHHRNWRHQISEDLNRGALRDDSFHYTSAYSLSKKDFAAIRDMLSKAIEDARDTVAPSPEETVACLTVDWFEL